MKNSNDKTPAAAASAENGRGMIIVMVVNLAIAVIGGVIVLVQFQSMRSLQRDHLEQSRENYRTMVQYQGDLYDIWKKTPREKAYEIPKTPGDLLSFIEEAHVRSGIEVGMRDRLNPVTRKIENGMEYSYQVSFRSDANRKMKRDHVVRFLIEVEKGRPFLKTQSVRVAFSPQALDEIASADIVLAYIIAEPKPK